MPLADSIQVSADISSGKNIPERSIQCGHVCSVYRRCRYGLIAKGEVSGSARIMGHRAQEAKISRCSNGRVDTHVGHHSGDHKLGDFTSAKRLKQRRFPKTVWKALGDDRLTWRWQHTRVDFTPCVFGRKNVAVGRIAMC